MAMEFGLNDQELSALRETFAAFPEVEEAIIYGSRARGTNRDSSDIDITLKGKALTYLQLALLDAQIDDLYLPYFVDLSLFSSSATKICLKVLIGKEKYYTENHPPNLKSLNFKS